MSHTKPLFLLCMSLAVNTYSADYQSAPVTGDNQPRIYRGNLCQATDKHIYFSSSSNKWSITNPENPDEFYVLDSALLNNFSQLIAGKYNYNITNNCFTEIDNQKEAPTIDPQKTEIEKNSKTLKEQKLGIVKNNTTLEQQASAILNNNTTLEQQASAILNNKTTLEQQASSIYQKNKALEEQNTNIKNNNTTLMMQNTEIINVQAKISSLNAALKALDKTAAGLITEGLSNQISALASTVQEQHKNVLAKVQAINEQTHTLKSDLEALRTRQIRTELLSNFTLDVRPFKSGRSDLTKDTKAALDDFINRLRVPHPDMLSTLSFEIQGHTDQLGASSYNLDLGRKRAEAVLHYLQVTHNIPAGSLSISSHGKEKLAKPGKSRSDRSENRRVTLRVYKAISTDPSN